MSDPNKIRVLIVDDSLLTRVVLRDILSRDPAIVVAGEARDGREAVAATLRLQPDLVLMDVIMPVMDGLCAVEEIMASRPTPILVLSANVSPTEAQGAFSAIQRGALDVMEKPQGIVKAVFEEIAAELIGKVKALARVKVMHHYRRARQMQTGARLVTSAPGAYSILAIGASTGGPRAVLQILKALPQPARCSVLIVQHIASGFAEGFARWLGHETGHSVRVARNQEQLAPGVVFVAPTDRHMELNGGALSVFEGPLLNSCRPSVDVLFKSLARRPASAVAAVLLTGMGRDGAEGMALLKMAGAWTIAQDEKSSIVFGMPRAAIELDAVCQVLSLAEIARALPGLLVK